MNEATQHQLSLRRKLIANRWGLRAIPLQPESLLAFFKLLDGQRILRCEGLPPDAELERVEVDQRSGLIVLIVRSSLWTASVLQSRIPWLELKFV